jgi:glutamate/tyrosine decarboxylase-like PLP-dependent enzyme
VGPIAAAASAAGARCHVDACIGGWVLPHLRASEPDQEPWTFAVEGVTSISIDLHKYAYTPKGVSILLHRTAELRRSHLFASARWPGYTMLNTTMQSTKSGGPVAAAWAVVNHIGVEGYATLALRARRGTLALARVVDGIEQLTLAAQPDSTLLAVTADESCDVFTISDELLTRGWYAQPQMSFGDLDATLHFTLSAATVASLSGLAVDLVDATAAAVELGPTAPTEELVVAASSVDPEHLDEETFAGLLAVAGLADESGALALPARMAPINALLDALPPELREALLTAVLDRLTRPV